MRVDKIADFINKSKTTQKVLRAVSDNPALASAGVSFIAAGLIRPATQGILPVKEDTDKKYIIASSVAAGVTGLLFATALFIPTNKVIQKASKSLYSSVNDTIYKGNNLLLRQFKSINSRLVKIFTMPVTSWLRFAAIAPFVKILFGKNNTKEVKKVGEKLDYEC